MQPSLLILAAGMGSRYGSLKQVDRFGPSGETIVEYSLFDALRAGFGKIVLDMGQVKWVNSSGLGTLIAAMTSVKNKGGEMKLARVTDKVESLFAITQLIKVFKTYETVDRAVGSFK